MDQISKLVLLSTENNTKIGRDTCTGNLIYLQDEPKCLIGYHLYILSDEEIKERDRVLQFILDKPLDYIQVTKEDLERTLFNWKAGSAKKIIATTNPDLISEGIASIDAEFVREYCNNPIEEVKVEYDRDWDEKGRAYWNTPYIVKLSSNGSIIIKPVENSWEKILNNLEIDGEFDKGIFTVQDFKNWLKENYEILKKK